MAFPLQHTANRALLLCLLLLQGVQHVEGHYGFPFLLKDEFVSERWEYIRPTTSFAPNFDYSGPDSMCGFNATKAIFPVKTFTVAAGSTIGFGVSDYTNAADESKATAPFQSHRHIWHQGPATAYMSKAPGDLNDYEGDGDWFKIAAVGASDGLTWDYSPANLRHSLNFTIPATTPPGKYLLRAEHFNIQPDYKQTQMYINCAHIEVTGPGGGNPGPVTKFPGAFRATDPGIWLANALWYPVRPVEELKNWQGAGPKVWTG
ncbi:hypothetical protein BDW02DRAFT_599068 [Decorospora gaudefroyi]|uniref:lytic cellulose monooxygenase (C4-dehydrogenating) n=1 Tax=Decorospora gaudefroyi TaxID=184978 RepID=A0A6A5KAB3_9PLEO|nr:hypothetical protein BDW02DRAFT_599068 [Decorospora gaudefroyi]